MSEFKFVNPYMDEDERFSFHRGDRLTIGDYTIRPHKMMQGHWDAPTHTTITAGWVVCDSVGCNILPGATWSYTKTGAIALLHCLVASGGKGKKFWALHRMMQSMITDNANHQKVLERLR